MKPTLEQELRGALRELDADRFTNHKLLERTPWLWNTRQDYVNWKSGLALGLQVDPYSLMVVGSACTGVSLNPKKVLFGGFRQDSDIDVAVVSQHHFELAWKTLREMNRIGGHVPTRTQRQMIKQHKEHLVFDRTIATDWILNHLPFGAEWREALLNSETTLPGGRHPVKARIYRDVDALRDYHLRNVSRIKGTLELASVDALAEGSDEGVPLTTAE